MTEAEHEAHSRWLNGMTGGDPDETFCSRIWRERWRRPWLWLVIWKIDREAMLRHGEQAEHCRRAAENHALRRSEPDQDPPNAGRHEPRRGVKRAA